ncbi:MAG TPA: protein kinase, partial [Polyangiaceae bacterium]
QVGVMVGTPYYMSPEQAASIEAVPQSDLYSCGVVMFLLATGTLPFMGSSPLDVAAMHLNKPAPRPSEFNAAVDPRLEKIILACLAKAPEQRPSSAAKLAGLLEHIVASDDAEPEALSIPLTRRTSREQRTRWTTAGAIAAFAAAGGFALSQLTHGMDAAAAATTGVVCTEPVSVLSRSEQHPADAPLAAAIEVPRPLAAPPPAPAPGLALPTRAGSPRAASSATPPLGEAAARL